MQIIVFYHVIRIEETKLVCVISKIFIQVEKHVCIYTLMVSVAFGFICCRPPISLLHLVIFREFQSIKMIGLKVVPTHRASIGKGIICIVSLTSTLLPQFVLLGRCAIFVKSMARLVVHTVETLS